MGHDLYYAWTAIIPLALDFSPVPYLYRRVRPQRTPNTLDWLPLSHMVLEAIQKTDQFDMYTSRMSQFRHSTPITLAPVLLSTRVRQHQAPPPWSFPFLSHLCWKQAKNRRDTCTRGPRGTLMCNSNFENTFQLNRNGCFLFWRIRRFQ